MHFLHNPVINISIPCGDVRRGSARITIDRNEAAKRVRGATEMFAESQNFEGVFRVHQPERRSLVRRARDRAWASHLPLDCVGTLMHRLHATVEGGLPVRTRHCASTRSCRRESCLTIESTDRLRGAGIGSETSARARCDDKL